MGIITNTINNIKSDFTDIDNQLSKLKTYVGMAAKQALPTHEIEKNIFQQVFAIGRQTLGSSKLITYRNVGRYLEIPFRQKI